MAQRLAARASSLRDERARAVSQRRSRFGDAIGNRRAARRRAGYLWSIGGALLSTAAGTSACGFLTRTCL
jgi:hypothetical protein